MIGEKASYLRLRHDVNQQTFSFDLKMINLSKTNGISDEYECKINNLESFENVDKMLLLLGYKKGCVVDKIRESWNKGEVEVVMDTVQNLGNFVEVEIVSDEEDSHNALARVYEAAAQIGLGKKKRYKLVT